MLTSLGARVRARLIPDARQAHKLWSVRILAAGAALLSAWSEIPAGVREQLPVPSNVGAGLLVAAAIARILKQGDANG